MALARGAPSNGRLKAGIVGCGGRGTQAVANLLTGNENIDLVAMADVFEDALEGSLNKLRYNTAQYVNRDAGITVERGGKPVQQSVEELVASIKPRLKVDPEHHFVGFDSFQKLIKSDVDIVLLTTPPGYRPQHFEAAINAGKHVFTEKPIATDPVGVRRFMAAVKLAEEKKLTVMSGAQRHADKPYFETVDKIHNGAIDNYQLVVPTTWNGSPRDAKDQRSSFEQALIGTPVAKIDEPLEILRTIHSFDPCLACAVHLYDPQGRHLHQISFE